MRVSLYYIYIPSSFAFRFGVSHRWISLPYIYIYTPEVSKWFDRGFEFASATGAAVLHVVAPLFIAAQGLKRTRPLERSSP